MYGVSINSSLRTTVNEQLNCAHSCFFLSLLARFILLLITVVLLARIQIIIGAHMNELLLRLQQRN